MLQAAVIVGSFTGLLDYVGGLYRETTHGGGDGWRTVSVVTQNRFTLHCADITLHLEVNSVSEARQSSSAEEKYEIIINGLILIVWWIADVYGRPHLLRLQ